VRAWALGTLWAAPRGLGRGRAACLPQRQRWAHHAVCACDACVPLPWPRPRRLVPRHRPARPADDPETSLLEVIRTCFLPRLAPGASGLLTCGSGAGFVGASPRVSGGAGVVRGGCLRVRARGRGVSLRCCVQGWRTHTHADTLAHTHTHTHTHTHAHARARARARAGRTTGGGAPHAAPAACAALAGHSRHPAASHRIVVSTPGGGGAGGGDSLAVLSQSDILRCACAPC
jgi:hypothetical protein